MAVTALNECQERAASGRIDRRIAASPSWRRSTQARPAPRSMRRG